MARTLAAAWPKLIQQINNKIIYNIIATGQQKHFHLRHEVKSFPNFCFFFVFSRGRWEGLILFFRLVLAWFFHSSGHCCFYLCFVGVQHATFDFLPLFFLDCRINIFMHRSVRLLWDAREPAISRCQVTWVMPRKTNRRKICVLGNCISFGHLTRPWPHSHQKTSINIIIESGIMHLTPRRLQLIKP